MRKQEKLWIITKAISNMDEESSMFEITDRIEWALITEAMNLSNGNIAKAARELGMGRTTLAMRISNWKQDQMVIEEFHAAQDSLPPATST